MRASTKITMVHVPVQIQCRKAWFNYRMSGVTPAQAPEEQWKNSSLLGGGGLYQVLSAVDGHILAISEYSEQ